MKALIPRRVQIETVFGCPESCVMCAVHAPTGRTPGIMDIDTFNRIIANMKPWRDSIEMLDLVGLGEPLVDPTLTDKIIHAKREGFRNLAFTTNGVLLNDRRRNDILETGIETVIFSIYGSNQEIHDSVMITGHFDEIEHNIREMITLRDSRRHSTRFILIFIRQEANIDDWDNCVSRWWKHLNPTRRDMMIRYDRHSWGGVHKDFIDPWESACPSPCPVLSKRMTVLVDGTVPMCCMDAHRCRHRMGDIVRDDIATIYNNERFKDIRKRHEHGLMSSVPLCGTCTIHLSETSRITVS